MANITEALGGLFDANNVEPTSIGSLPAGLYEVSIADAEVTDTRAGTGKMLKVEYDVTGPTHANRKVWQYINLTNANQQAEQIGRGQLSSLCRAVGIAQLKDSDELLGRQLRVRLKVRPAKGDYEESNDVAAHESLSMPAAPVAAQAAQQATPAAKKAAAPWAKKAA